MAEGSKNTTIIANIEAITKATKRLAVGSKEAASAAKLLAQEYELGIGSSSVLDVFNQYQTAIDKVNSNIREYQKSIKQLEADRASLNDIEGENSKLYNTLTSKIATYTNSLKRERETLVTLTAEQKKYSAETLAAAEAEKQAAATKELNAQKIAKLKGAQQTLNKVMRTAKIVVSALVIAFKKMTSAAIEQGTELYSLSKRYGASVGEIQTMNRALQLATGQSDLFTSSLSVLAKGMSDIAGNRGQKYTAALRAIGTSYKALSEMSKAEQFSAIIQGLQGIENESVRAAHAQTLLGESGQYIVGALEQGKYSLEDYIKQAEKYSVLTTQNAEDLAFLGFQMEYIKSQQSVLTAQMTIDALPTILGAMNLLKGLIPVLNFLIKNNWLLYVALLALLSIKVVSMFMSWRVAALQATTAMAKLTAGALFAKAALGGLLAVGAAVAVGVALWGASAKDFEDNINGAANAASKMNGLSGEYTSNIERTVTASNERTVNISVDIYGEGDTAVSDGAATTIAQLTADEVNRNLGALIKGN